ncbi:MAG: MBL fold metallo-hydrolase, partial [Acidiferrobacterales bacterium]
PHRNIPASEFYLTRLGVDAKQVCCIVASHWHDDHVRGIANLATTYPNADFIISAVFNHREAAAFLAAYGGASSAGLARGAKELFSVISTRKNVSAVLHRSIVLEMTINKRTVLMTALSPVQAVFAQSIAHMAQYLPQKDQPINHIPELRPNLAAVALHIDLGDDAILLGADLEEHETFGWSAVVADQWSGKRRPATAYKVAHHGSVTGDCPDVWKNLLKPDPVACLTPFTHGNVRLPTDTDKGRVKHNAGHAYISSGASRRPDIDSRVLKRLGDICKNLAQVDAGFGAVRLRKKIGAISWGVELFESAVAL